MDLYSSLFLRNAGYVADDVQQKIRNTRALIAGCGVGSSIAEALARLGIEKMTLADGDTVEVHNLNRQIFDYTDVGKNKAEALAGRVRAINPGADITVFPHMLDEHNVKDLVAANDFVLDTVDFLDLKAIIDLHDEAHRQNKHAISAVTAGWGGAAMYFPPGHGPECGYRYLFGLPQTGSIANESYVEKFSGFLGRIGAHLDPAILRAMAKALTVMEDGTPCPAPHVSAGSFTVGALCATLVYRILAGEKVVCAPGLNLVNIGGIVADRGIDLTPQA